MCTPGRHRAELWLWSFSAATFRNQFSLWKTMDIFWFGSEPSFHLSGHWVQRGKKKNPSCKYFWSTGLFFLLAKLKLIIWFCPRDLVCSKTGDWIIITEKCYLDWFQTWDLLIPKEVLSETERWLQRGFSVSTFLPALGLDLLFSCRWKSGQFANVVYPLFCFCKKSP